MEGGGNIVANLFKYIGLVSLVGGIILVVLSSLGVPDWNSGDAVIIDALEAGSLFTVMGVGFMTFGFMVKSQGWEHTIQD